MCRSEFSEKELKKYLTKYKVASYKDKQVNRELRKAVSKTVSKLLGKNFIDDVMDYPKFKLPRKLKDQYIINLNEAT